MKKIKNFGDFVNESYDSILEGKDYDKEDVDDDDEDDDE